MWSDRLADVSNPWPELIVFADDARRRLSRVGLETGVWSSALLRSSDRLVVTESRHDAEIEAYGVVPVVAIVDDLAGFALDLSSASEVDKRDLEDARQALLDAHPDYRHVRDVLVHATAYQAGVGHRQHPNGPRWESDRTPQLAPMDVWVSGSGSGTEIGMAGTDARPGHCTCPRLRPRLSGGRLGSQSLALRRDCVRSQRELAWLLTSPVPSRRCAVLALSVREGAPHDEARDSRPALDSRTVAA